MVVLYLHVQGLQDQQKEQKDAGLAPPRGPEAPADAEKGLLIRGVSGAAAQPGSSFWSFKSVEAVFCPSVDLMDSLSLNRGVCGRMLKFKAFCLDYWQFLCLQAFYRR